MEHKSKTEKWKKLNFAKNRFTKNPQTQLNWKLMLKSFWRSSDRQYSPAKKLCSIVIISVESFVNHIDLIYSVTTSRRDRQSLFWILIWIPFIGFTNLILFLNQLLAQTTAMESNNLSQSQNFIRHFKHHLSFRGIFRGNFLEFENMYTISHRK